jgi:hypothetical protein
MRKTENEKKMIQRDYLLLIDILFTETYAKLSSQLLLEVINGRVLKRKGQSGPKVGYPRIFSLINEYVQI